MLSKLDLKASLEGLVIIRDDRLPVRRIPLREKPLPRYVLPYRGLLGLLIVAIAWPLSWVLDGEVGQNSTFFPLWLGFILIADGLVLRRTGTSLIVRSPKIVAVMFVAAVPYWWMFEGINLITQNWVYIGPENRTLVNYLDTSLSFSVVIAAVFELSELVGSFGFIRRFSRLPALVLSQAQIQAVAILGILSFAALLLWPTYLFPLTWLSLFFIFDPINHLTGRPSIISQVKKGDWRLVIAFALGALACGFFWEMWNNTTSVSWKYDFAYLDFGRVFQMPIIGYGGYLPFGLETYAVFHFVAGVFGWSSDSHVPMNGDAQTTSA
ncbi:MAG: hypothetical protein HQ475_14815 [SAR202 cluster bacterium]|nr:hypothetical protein [SAR202 cluster bacterium]